MIHLSIQAGVSRRSKMFVFYVITCLFSGGN